MEKTENTEVRDRRPNQCQLILEYMREYGSIEPMQALGDLGVYRLGSRIHDLREQGYDISTERVTTRSRRTGYPVTYARYSLKQ